MATLFRDITKSTDDLLTKEFNNDREDKQERRNVNFKTQSKDGKVTVKGSWAQLFKDGNEKTNVNFDWKLCNGISITADNTYQSSKKQAIAKVTVGQKNYFDGVSYSVHGEFNPNNNKISEELGYGVSVEAKKKDLIDSVPLAVNVSGGRNLEKKATNVDFGLTVTPNAFKFNGVQGTVGVKGEFKNLGKDDAKDRETNVDGGFVLNGDGYQFYSFINFTKTHAAAPAAASGDAANTDEKPASTPAESKEASPLPVGFTVGGSIDVRPNISAAGKIKFLQAKQSDNELVVAGQKTCGNEKIKAKVTLPLAGDKQARIGGAWSSKVSSTTSISVFADLNFNGVVGETAVAEGQGNKFGGKLSFNTVD